MLVFTLILPLNDLNTDAQMQKECDKGNVTYILTHTRTHTQTHTGSVLQRERVMLGFGFCDVEALAEGQHVKRIKVYKKYRHVTVLFMNPTNCMC